MAQTKEQLVGAIREWVSLDKEMKKLQKEIKTRRERKKLLTAHLAETMKENEIDCFDITDGKIVFSQNKVKAPISKKHLLESLDKYFQDKPGDPSSEIAEFILDSRAVKTKDNIRLKTPK
mgnify:CR=1 FL=1